MCDRTAEEDVMHWLRHASRALAILLAVTSAHGQTTQQPVRIVFPFSPGGASDALVRVLAESMQNSLGRPVIVENKVGAGGRIGVQMVKHAPPDGSVLLVTPLAPMVVFPHVYDNLGYDAFADFHPISQIATFDLAVAVGKGVPAKSVQELLAWLKSNPAQAHYGSPAAGSLPHFFAVQLGRMIGIDLSHVAYKGSPPAIADLIGGHLPAYFGPTQELVEAHRAGSIRILATSGASRSPALPDMPTFREAGYAIEADVWYGVYAPGKTPPEVTARLNKAVVAAVQTPEIGTRMLALGLRLTGSSSAELARIQRADFERWGPAVKASGFKPTQ
jgi:tripartite-type tricarboxylate transporter receptor subunit TctC